jgi:predicted regulator of Ras-like GTPase activity (Roadblock/LC7/MglB family)
MNVHLNEFDMVDGPSSRPSGGFRAHLQGVNLHDLIQVENLARSTGVFVVLSGDRVGYLHMLGGDLIHAEVEGLSGEAAALEILSWHEGEFSNCERLLAQRPTVHASLQALLMRLAKESDEARHSESPMASTGTRRKDSGARAIAGRDSGKLVTQRLPVLSRAARLSSDGLSRAEVLLNDRGEMLDGRGRDYDELASQVAYAARLAELVGQSLGAGESRAIEVHGKTNEVLIRWLPNANVIGIVRAAKGADGDPAANGEAMAVEIEATPIEDDASEDDTTSR